MTIQTIYDHYHIPPNLQRHMYEVTAVGRYLVDHWKGEDVDKKMVTEVLLLHDMGNIIKFKRPFLGELEERVEYWELVQEQFIEKYGNDVHRATKQIVAEVLGQNSPVLAILDTMGFHTIEKEGYQSTLSRICDHADMLVSPEGVVSFSERMTDLIVRYHLSENENGIMLRRENAQFIQDHVDKDLEKIGEVDWSAQIREVKQYRF